MQVNKQDNSIHIGDKNKIKKSVIGHHANSMNKKEKWFSKLFWKLFIPVAVIIIATALCLWLDLK